MTNQTFYQHFNRNTLLIQNLASQLTSDFETARLLYLETAHKAMKNRKQLNEDDFDNWLKQTMQEQYHQLIN